MDHAPSPESYEFIVYSGKDGEYFRSVIREYEERMRNKGKVKTFCSDSIALFGEPFDPSVIERVVQVLYCGVQRTLESLKLKSTYTEQVEVIYDFDCTDGMATHSARISRNPGKYTITMEGGRSWLCHAAAQVFRLKLAGLEWLDTARLPESGQSVRDALYQLSLYICANFIIFHELSHIILGHNDYFSDILSVGQGPREGTPEYYSIRVAFEAEADRQASTLTGLFAHDYLGESQAGVQIIFESHRDAYKFYIFSLASLFMTQDGKDNCYPSVAERLYTIVFSLLAYMKKVQPAMYQELHNLVPMWAVEAGRLFGIRGMTSHHDYNACSLAMVRVDEAIQRYHLRKYQFSVS